MDSIDWLDLVNWLLKLRRWKTKQIRCGWPICKWGWWNTWSNHRAQITLSSVRNRLDEIMRCREPALKQIDSSDVRALRHQHGRMTHANYLGANCHWRLIRPPVRQKCWPFQPSRHWFCLIWPVTDESEGGNGCGWPLFLASVFPRLRRLTARNPTTFIKEDLYHFFPFLLFDSVSIFVSLFKKKKNWRLRLLISSRSRDDLMTKEDWKCKYETIMMRRWINNTNSCDRVAWRMHDKWFLGVSPPGIEFPFYTPLNHVTGS